MPPKRGGKAPAFPAARVKRIMQQDDEVGKVATASPVVMAKATELFLQEMLNSIEREARAKSTKKVSMYHVKRAVENTPSLDFLKDLVATIPDPAGADDEYESSEKPTKKRAQRSKAGTAHENGRESASPASHMQPAATATASSSSTSASGLKKVKLSHSAPQSAAMPEASDPGPSNPNSTFSLPPMPAPQASSRPNVAIPISSLLSDTGMNYGPPDGEIAFESAGSTAEDVKPEVQPPSSRNVQEDDDYDNDEAKADVSMKADPTVTQTDAPPVQAEAIAYKREEDEDYDEE